VGGSGAVGGQSRGPSSIRGKSEGRGKSNSTLLEDEEVCKKQETEESDDI